MGHIDDMAILLEQALEDPSEAFVVLDDEEMHQFSPQLHDDRRGGGAAARSRLVIICGLPIGRPREGVAVTCQRWRASLRGG